MQPSNMDWLADLLNPTVLVALFGSVATTVVALAGFWHQRKLAQEARQADRQERAYVAALDMAHQVRNWAERVDHGYPFDPDQQGSNDLIPPPANQANVRALVEALGSDRVRLLYAELDQCVSDMSAGVSLAYFFRTRTMPPGWPDPPRAPTLDAARADKDQISAYAKRITAAIDMLAAQIQHELGGGTGKASA